MDIRHFQRLVFIMNLLFSLGNLAKETEDSSRYISISATSLAYVQKSKFNEKVKNSTLHDIVTPIPTVPAINPSNPTASTSPAYNQTPTDSNPTTTIITPSTMNPTNPYTTSSGLSWCIASQSASQTPLQVALDFACGYDGADCSQIQPGGSCFDPDTVRDHASYAFNDYYLKNPIPTSCDFGGTAIITNVDPSTPTCQYPSTSISYSVLNTTNPSGSTVFGSSPPDSSGRDPTLGTLPLCLTFLGIILAVS